MLNLINLQIAQFHNLALYAVGENGPIYISMGHLELGELITLTKKLCGCEDKKDMGSLIEAYHQVKFYLEHEKMIARARCLLDDSETHIASQNIIDTQLQSLVQLAPPDSPRLDANPLQVSDAHKKYAFYSHRIVRNLMKRVLNSGDTDVAAPEAHPGANLRIKEHANKRYIDEDIRLEIEALFKKCETYINEHLDISKLPMEGPIQVDEWESKFQHQLDQLVELRRGTDPSFSLTESVKRIELKSNLEHKSHPHSHVVLFFGGDSAIAETDSTSSSQQFGACQ